MKHFWKAIRLSFRYKWTILLSVLNALCIAFLWSASISTVYPFVEVVFEGKTVHSWLDDGIAGSEAEIRRLEAEIAGLRQQFNQETDAEKRGAITGHIAVREGHLTLHEQNRDSKLRLKPYAERWGPRTPFGTLLVVIVGLILVTALKGVCLVLSVVLVARISSGTTVDLRRIFFREMLRMDQRTIDRLGTSNLMTMLSHNVNMIQAGLQSLYGRSLIEPFKMLACLACAFVISWQLLLVSMLIVPLGAYLIHYLGRRMRRAAGSEIAGYATLFQTLLDVLDGIKLVRIFGRERFERQRFKKDARALYRMHLRIAFFDSLLRPITELMAICTLSTAILCGAYLVLTQETHLFGLRMCARPLSAAEVFTFFAMLSGTSDPARKLTDIYNVLVRAIMGSQGLFTTFETKPQITAPACPRPAPRHQRSLRFDNVTFGYERNLPVLRNFSLEIPFGQTVALIGVNGCGKSTITNLIARFYDPDSGTVYLDGVDLRDIRPRQLRRQISIVTQDPLLFRGTVWSNIRYSNPGATPWQALRATRTAHVTDFLPELPRGVRTNVGERGNALSGGQRQRVALARALLADPRIFILDEATSQLDVEAEAAVHESIRRYLRQRTTILITHRLSTLLLADRVVILRAGQVVEDRPITAVGRKWETFAELLAKAA